MRHIRALDGIRGLAVVAVMASHLPHLGVADGGWLGVDVFFVLSGYLITALLLTEHAAAGRISLRRFYARRILRLYPALVLLILLGLPFYQVLGWLGTPWGYAVTAAISGSYLQDLAYGLTGMSFGRFGHTWSLAVEEQFYLLWPPALIWLLRGRRSVVHWGLAGVAVSVGLLFAVTEPGLRSVPISYALPHTRAFELLLGCVLAAGWQRLAPRLTGRMARRLLAPAALAGLVALAAWSAQAGRRTTMPEQVTLAGLLSVLLLAGVLADTRQPLARLLAARPLAAVGTISYGLYLYHRPVYDVLGHHGVPATPAGRLLMVAVAFAVALASYHLVERRALALKRRWATLPAPASPSVRLPGPRPDPTPLPSPGPARMGS